MQVAILSAEPKLDNTLHRVINEYAIRKFLKINIVSFTSYNVFLNSENNFDIIFIDDDFDGKSAIETAGLVKTACPEVALVLLSGDINTVYDAFKVKAHRFLMKPPEPISVIEAIESYRRDSFSYKMVIAKVDNVFRSFCTDEILYVEASGKHTRIFTAKEPMIASTSFNQLVEQLPEEYFFLIHRSFAINMMYVDSFNQESVKMRNSDDLPLSRRRKIDFYIKFTDFTKSHTFFS